MSKHLLVTRHIGVISGPGESPRAGRKKGIQLLKHWELIDVHTGNVEMKAGVWCSCWHCQEHSCH